MSPTQRTLTPAEEMRLASNTFTPADYRKYLRTEQWKGTCIRAEKAWREAQGYKPHEPLECCCGCGRPYDSWHHANSGYKNLFVERPMRDLRPMAARCHRKLHAGRKR